LAALAGSARADVDYYQALAGAERAAAAGTPDSGLQLVEQALQTYPNDYALTAMRGYLLLQLGRYRDAEDSYRRALSVSQGAIPARSGLAWALQGQGDCEAAAPEFRAVLAASPQDADAQRGLALCERATALHGSGWLTAGVALFRADPWKHHFVDTSAGLTLLPGASFAVGAAYHYLNLSPTDARVAQVKQHELYLQAGLANHELQLLAHGALVWSGDPQLDGSLHAGLSGRYYLLPRPLKQASLELTASRYPDGWVGRAATSWLFGFDVWNITGGVSLIRAQTQTLAAISLSLGIDIKALTVWIGGKYGQEYRAAYLSQFALLNSEDRSLWSFSGGTRFAMNEHWTLFGSYLYLRAQTPDGLLAGMHLANLGIAFGF
jgi:tetratricopeptide (TPR) repeat protein